MKKMITSWLMAMLAITMFSQKDVTTFLGIPIDGYKPAMRQKLIAKGFVPKKTQNSECFEGEFNGTDVQIFIGTNNNKVYRLMISDVNLRGEADIRIRFNNLVNQFKNNERYVSVDDYTISDSEDISYEMMVHNKVYQASFYQLPVIEKLDTLALREQVKKEMLKKHSQEQLDNPTEEISKESEIIAARIGIDIITKKSVWFRIFESFGKYYISMYYDNEYNKANGEDL